MEISNQLLETIQSYAVEFDVDVRTDYSGRHMYGAHCLGLSGNFSSIMNVMHAVTSEIHDLSAGGDEYENLWNEWMNFSFDFQMDSMGCGSIIYWPRVQVIEQEAA